MKNQKVLNKLNLICIITIFYLLLASYSYTMFIFSFVFFIVNGLIIVSFISNISATSSKLPTYVYIVLSYILITTPISIYSYNFFLNYICLLKGCFNPIIKKNIINKIIN